MFSFIEFKFDDGWKIIEAAATAAAASVALWQVFSIRKEGRKAATIAACDRYDTDPILDQYIRQLSVNRADVVANPAKYRLAISTVLNYLDGVAIGVAQGLYIDKLAKDHLEKMVAHYVPKYLMDQATVGILSIQQIDYRHLLAMYARWSKPTTNYRPFWPRRD